MTETADAAAPAETEPTGDHSATPPATPAPSAIIAVPLATGRNDKVDWSGRILEHAPGPAETARILHTILTTRFKGHTRVSQATDEVLAEHPAGWEYLGPEPGAKAGRTRRDAPLGRCRCHQADGTARPGLLYAAHRALRAAEWGPDYRPTPDPGEDGAPWKISSRQSVTKDVAHLFLINGERFEVHARDQSAEDHFTLIARLSLRTRVDWDEIGDELDQASAQVRQRPKRDWNREYAAKDLARAAKLLGTFPSHVDLVLYLLGGGARHEYAAPNKQAEAALAAAAGVHGAELFATLHNATRAEQVRLLTLAAHQLRPAEHPAP
jgi:hypothetical protein